MKRKTDTKSQAGFALLEVMISTVILTVGLVGLLSVFGVAVGATQSAQQDAIAKQLATEAYETVFTARDTADVTFDQIQNVGTGSGIFVLGMQPIYNAGADGIYGTGDDYTAGYQQLLLPGPDGISGTSDDVKINLSNFQRQIAIVPVLDSNNNPISNLREVTVTVQYTLPNGVKKSYVLDGYISQYR